MTHKDIAREAQYELLEEIRAALGRPISRDDIMRWAKDMGLAIAAERERCAKVCESSAKRYEELAIAARESRGPLSNSEANEYMWAAECARQQAKQIRGQNG